MNKILLFTLLHFSASLVFGQNCSYSLSGKIEDRSTHEGLAFSTLRFVETEQGVVSDVNGDYKIDNLCPGEYHVVISHMGFESDRFYLKIEETTQHDFHLDHHEEMLNEVTVHGDIHTQSSMVSQSISEEDINSAGNKNLADMVESISGVSVIKNGSGISKPVIHGLYGNRISILNNGVVQAGQQWGVDHAPEIDPFSADHISVIKGAQTLAHNGNSVGGILMVEPGPINMDPHLHGNINYAFQTNGLGHTLNTKIEKTADWAAWRINLTGKLLGDTYAPDYFLTNTGRQEINGSLQLEKRLTENWKTSFYLSTFNTSIGILKGSHVGNQDDLEDAMKTEPPLYTKDHFSYNINEPRQKINHQLVKLNTNHILSPHQIISISYAGQFNQRNEYDVRRGGRSSKPAMSLLLIAHDLDFKYDHTFSNDFDLETGIQNTLTTNKNDNKNTGTLPLIPDYNSNKTGLYIIGKQGKDRLFFEIGARVSYRHLEAITITKSTPKIIERFDHHNINYSAIAGLGYSISQMIKTNFSISYSQRSPEVNEWYSDGLHQGVASIERGNRNLIDESMFGSNLSFDLTPFESLFFQVQFYSQYFNNYIYLEPQEEQETNIRGTFNVFEYNQIKNAHISGLDLAITYHPSHHLKCTFTYTMLYGQDLNLKQPLIYMPPNNLDASTQYTFNKFKNLRNTYVGVQVKYMFEQKRFVEEQDLSPPPNAYLLFNFNFGTKVSMRKNEIALRFSINNLLNTSYRDYLNRLRYFADEQGRNFTVSASYSF
ncbi:MAG: TonB-dependent receptor [Reichenbachiella sp.]